MNSTWKKARDEYESSAKVVDGNLILSLPDAINPIVWRMELGSVKASALEVKPQAADGTSLLTLKTPKGEVHDIAPFQTREQAVRALMRVSAALQGAHGRITPVTSAINNHATNSIAPAVPTSDRNSGNAIKWLLTLGGVLVVIFLFAYLSTLTPQDEVATGAMSTAGAGAEQDSGSGVPQSADELLRGY